MLASPLDIQRAAARAAHALRPALLNEPHLSGYIVGEALQELLEADALAVGPSMADRCILVVSAMTRQCQSGRRSSDLETLRAEIAAWSKDVNTRQRGVDLSKEIGGARRKLWSVYPKTLY